MASPVKDNSPSLERFISAHLVGREHEFRRTEKPQNHEALVQAALRRKKVQVQSVDSRNRNFTFGTDVIGGMDRMVTTLVSDLARRVSADKWLSKKQFELQGLPVPAGQEFSAADVSDAAHFMRSLTGDAVLKPATARSGRGITLGIRTAEDLEQAWPRALEARLSGEGARQTVLLEEHREGLDMRIFVVGEQAVSVLVRVPTYVVGDGRSTLRQLLDSQSRLRSAHRHLAAHTPEIAEDELNSQGLTFEAALGLGEVRVLREQANIREGGLPVDVTDQTHDSLKELAVEALWSIPGLAAGAVDLLVPDHRSAEGAAVLEVNAGASIVPHRYPAYGKPRSVAERIADQILLRRA